ncbi:predicted protein, partial [Nematostella vectensis]
METFVGLFDSSPRNGVASSPLSVPLPECLPPEVEEGNIEYKLKLVNPSPSRLVHLVTQMKWRLQEGQGEAIYGIGVEDNGGLVGLPEKELKSSLATLNTMASKLGATTSILRQRNVEEMRKVVEVLVRQVPDDQQ